MFSRVVLCTLAGAGLALSQPAPPEPFSSHQLDQLVARVALYPDPLLAQLLTATTYCGDIPEAAVWPNLHTSWTGDDLAKAIHQDNLPWDPTVIALLPFPSVLKMLADDPAWSHQLGNAVLLQLPEVMDAVQRLRRKAVEYGYLQANQYVNVSPGNGGVEMLPTDARAISVPVYDPRVVFAKPPAGPAAGSAVQFGPAVTITAAFAPWGWTHPGFLWPAHSLVIDGRPWERRWDNRDAYVHTYDHLWARPVGPPVEHHQLRRR